MKSSTSTCSLSDEQQFEKSANAPCTACRASQKWTVLLTSQKTPTESESSLRQHCCVLQFSEEIVLRTRDDSLCLLARRWEREETRRASVYYSLQGWIHGRPLSLSPIVVRLLFWVFCRSDPRCGSLLFLYPPPTLLLCLAFELTSHRSPLAAPHRQREASSDGSSTPATILGL